MIVEMAKLRILGPHDRLEAVLDLLQDLGAVHLDEPETTGPLRPVDPDPDRERETRHLRSILDDLRACLDALGPASGGGRPGEDAVPEDAETGDFARWARLADRLRDRLEALVEEEESLREERASLERYRQFFDAFGDLLEVQVEARSVEAHPLLLRSGSEEVVEGLEERLRETLGEGFELYSRELSGGGTAVLLLVPASASEEMDRLMARAALEELPVPDRFDGESVLAVAGPVRQRIEELDRRLAEVRAERRRLAEDRAEELREARAAIADRLLETEALDLAARTDHAFVLEGWTPAATTDRVAGALESRFDGEVVVEELGVEEWAGEEAPVELSNPRIFRPFEALTRVFPLPKYGSIDPTPFVAVFFPMFFGLALGDIAYGIALGLLAVVLRVRSRPGSTLRSVSEIAGACALFTVLFGAVFGEFLGDLGTRWFGLQPLVAHREEALIPFLLFTVALGVVHVLLGLVLGAASRLRSEPKHALGYGVSALMVLLITVAILASVQVLPARFFTPAVVALLVSFPVLVVLEGVLAPVELLSTLGNVLSYARIMALGTASVVMAVVANEMAGAVGGVVVGLLFGLLFHLVNFALGIFGPTVHGLRLQYVEFFGQFYSPGGERFDPFTHWRPGVELPSEPRPASAERGSHSVPREPQETA